MRASSKTWLKLSNRDYRDQFAEDDIINGLAFQIRQMRDSREWDQEKLATLMHKTQPQIAQWENPNYGRYTLKTLLKFRKAFDVALLVKFVPFSELVDWTANLTPERQAPPSYSEEQEQDRRQVEQNLRLADFSVAAGTPQDTQTRLPSSGTLSAGELMEEQATDHAIQAHLQRDTTQRENRLAIAN